jgi:hypothetical protein
MTIDIDLAGYDSRVMVDGKSLPGVEAVLVATSARDMTRATLTVFPEHVTAKVPLNNVSVTCGLCGAHHKCGDHRPEPTVGPSEAPPWTPTIDPDAIRDLQRQAEDWRDMSPLAVPTWTPDVDDDALRPDGGMNGP